VTRIGIIGLSEGNGHPFSFSAIINGFADSELAASGWKVIYDYVRARDKSEFGIEGFTVTHAWTQEPEQTRNLCRACLIQNAVAEPKDMLGEVDAVIIARDDYENHFRMAMPFLEAGMPVFVDKPLTLAPGELKVFRPYLERGKLMSCSGMRYAKELDAVRQSIGDYAPIRLIRGTIVLSWEKYGVHLLEAIFNVVRSRPVSVTALQAGHASMAITIDDGSSMQIDALGECARTFRVEFWGAKSFSSHDVTDNFSMFRRTLWHFGEMIRTGKAVIPPQDTLDVMRTLIAGRMSATEKRPVLINEIEL